MIYLQLFLRFFKVGLFAVGGGMATLPFLYELSDTTAWFTYSQLADMIAVSESTPGPIGINMATFVGYTTAGVPGAVIASVGLAAPSLLIILLISGIYQAYRHNKYVDGAFYGLRPCSVALIAAAGVLVVKIALLNTEAFAVTGSLGDLFNIKGLILAAVLVFFTRVFKPTKKLHPIVFILASALAGICFGF